MFGGIAINTRTVTFGIFAAILAVILQALPIAISDHLVFITVFSTLPIYIITRINPKIGLASYVAAGLISLLINYDAGIFFLLANGLLGYTLGILSVHIEAKVFTCLISGIILTITFCIMNYIIGISTVMSKLLGGTFLQIFIFFVISVIYSFLYLYLSLKVYDILNKYCYLDFEN